MLKSLIATVTAAAIALATFGSGPARASDEDLARALAVILGAAAIGKIIHDNRDDKKERRRARERQRYHEPVYRERRKQQSYHQPRRVEPRPLPRRVNRHLLPQDCFRSFNTRRGKIRMFGQQCLRNNFRFVNELPLNCRRTVETGRGTRTGFEAGCMRAEGYRLARG